MSPEPGRPSAVERIEQEEFARGHIGPDEEPVEPRPAATVVVARPGVPRRRTGGQAPPRTGFEVLLLRRPDSSRFAAGAFVFPGGVIDPADHDPSLEETLAPAAAGAPPELPALAAGIRELFEETGILPADRVPPREVLERARAALRADRTTLPALVERWGLAFHRMRCAYFARWITPERLARRYDTRFFLLAPGPGGWPEPILTAEHTAHEWARPDEAVARFHRGQLPMLLPTWKTLERLARFPDLDRSLAELRAGAVQTVRPRLLVEEGKVRPVMPGEPGYGRAR